MRYQKPHPLLCVVQPSSLVSLMGKAWIETNLNYKLPQGGFTRGGPHVYETRAVLDATVKWLTELLILEKSPIRLALQIDPEKNPPIRICGGVGLVVGLIIHQDGLQPITVPLSVSPSLVTLDGNNFYTNVPAPASVLIDAILAEVESQLSEPAQ